MNEKWMLVQNASQGYALYAPPSATVRRYDPEGILHIELLAEHQVLTVRVYNNPARLSAEQWANFQFPNGAMRIGDELGPSLPIINREHISIGERLAETLVLVGPTSLYQQVVLVNVNWAYLISYPVGHTHNENLFEQTVATFEIGDLAEDSGLQIFETDSTQTIASLSVPYYSQKDPQWICDQLGTCNCDFATCTTQTYTGIGDAGCFISSQAMIFEYYTANHFMNPQEFDTCLTNHGGYGSWSGCAYGLCGASYSPPSSCKPGSVSYELYSTNLAILDEDLSNGYPAIAWVDGGAHYVVVTGKSGGKYQINDPYYSRSEINPGEILHFVRYHGPVPTATPYWNFSNDSQGWSVTNGLSDSQFLDGGWWHRVSANDPHITGPMINVPADDYPYVFLQMASQTDSCGQIYFATQSSPSFTGEKFVSLTITANGGTEHLIVDMRSNPHWTGNIVQLRLDPACEAVNGKQVRIDRLALLKDDTSWGFSSDSQDWSVTNGLSDSQFLDGGWWHRVSANDPHMTSPMINVPAGDYPDVFLQMASQTDSCGQIYFATQSDPNFTGEKFVSLPIAANGGTERLIVDMRSSPHWTGNIIQLRLDPACEAVNGKQVRIDQLAFLSKASSWDFSRGLQGWQVGQGLNNQQQLEQGVWFNVSADDPYLYGPMINVSAADYPRLYLQMASQTDDCGQIYFRRQSDAGFAEERRVGLPIVANGNTNYLVIDMSSHPYWTGNVIQLRLDPACQVVNNHTLRIDQLMLTVVPTHHVYLPLVVRK